MKYTPIPEQYVSEVFKIYAEGSRQTGDKYIGGCPICREGKSWGKKHRLMYKPREDIVHCLNCGFTGSGIKFVAEVTGKDYSTILKECRDESSSIDAIWILEERKKQANASKIAQVKYINYDASKTADTSKSFVSETLALPYDCVDILNDEFAKKRIMKDGNRDSMEAVNYLKSRGLDISTNKGPLYLSKTDAMHSNRIIIPFYNRNRKLEFFQSRAYREKDKDIRYISSFGHHKNLYGIERVDFEKPYLFIQEGPLNCFFLKNSVAAGGINTSKRTVLTAKQAKEIALFPKKNIIWILDNPRFDKTAAIKMEILKELGYRVFDWSEIPGLDLHKCKDLNEYCAKNKLPGLPEELFVKRAN